MKVDRTLMRLTVPPVLSLGLVVLLTSPLAASSTTGPDVQRASLSGSSSENTPLGSGGGATGVHVGVPSVAFTESVTAVDGHLRTPVVLADDTVTGFASIDGASAGDGCTVELATGVPVWLDCAISITPGGEAQVVVTLSDGRTATKSITVD